ncbi:MAG: aminomethyl-transferring glycine dehydrogenase [Oligoflexia bacterium]|nr:aminomethyl-transferring glycine dehydrogenase [Oligoflexia bacterium]
MTQKNTSASTAFPSTDSFVERHLGPRARDMAEMLKVLGLKTLEELAQKTVPASIFDPSPLKLEGPISENEALLELRRIANQNQIYKSHIGLGYYDCVTPPVILRNILENPGWYTQYTPYQAEISQGRLEALLNFQTLISDLTGFPMANASLLDEGTAVAEAMALCLAVHKEGDTRRAIFVSSDCFPQTIDVVKTRASALGIDVKVGAPSESSNKNYFAAVFQYPNQDGEISDIKALIQKAQSAGVMVIVAADLLALTVLESPAKLGADVAVGSSQRFGVPMGFGGPHAAYMATKDEFKRNLPGRIIGVSIDSQGKPALRLALQTREQHIRRAKATSNICTAQVLLAVMASMYAVYHGPEGLKQIAERIHLMAHALSLVLKKAGFKISESFFDTIKVETGSKTADVLNKAEKLKINLRSVDGKYITVSLDETCGDSELNKIAEAFGLAASSINWKSLRATSAESAGALPKGLIRKTPYLTHPVFNQYHSETEMLRYMTRLQAKDLSLTSSMIPLGSCTMKLNATAEMIPVTWPEFGKIHPFAPKSQTAGYHELIERLETMLSAITGFEAVSLQPNAGSQGEYAGLLVIRKYHESRGESGRNICLIPNSAHGTNPASAAMAGMEIVAVECDARGNVSLEDLQKKANLHKDKLAALMVTYPSTHGVFEEGIVEICKIIHANGGQVYMDGANMNAQVGLCQPGKFGVDVCHLNLHKTFCIPHGGGGPGMGPICVKNHLASFLPGHSLVKTGGESAVGAVSSAPFGSASILPISFAYILMMGAEGLKLATEVAILNANYVAKKLDPHYPVLYKGLSGYVAHECIIDLRPLKQASGVEVMDVAKRLMDYGFHAPTVSFPVVGTMMIEPTESESKEELDRFCEAMIAIKREIDEIANGSMDKENNPLKNAPHTMDVVMAEKWDRPYSRERAAFPVSWVKSNKFWPAVSRINDPHGDRNLVCTCPPLASYSN